MWTGFSVFSIKSGGKYTNHFTLKDQEPANDLNTLVLLMRNKSEPAGFTYALPKPGLFVCFPSVYNPLWLYFHSPVAGFSLLVFEVS